ncbi:hypothetical protein ACOSP7_005679 [Xanthoceras sorbifolium]
MACNFCQFNSLWEGLLLLYKRSCSLNFESLNMTMTYEIKCCIKIDQSIVMHNLIEKKNGDQQNEIQSSDDLEFQTGKTAKTYMYNFLVWIDIFLSSLFSA